VTMPHCTSCSEGPHCWMRQRCCEGVPRRTGDDCHPMSGRSVTTG
jgi:hypothetical protein